MHHFSQELFVPDDRQRGIIEAALRKIEFGLGTSSLADEADDDGNVEVIGEIAKAAIKQLRARPQRTPILQTELGLAAPDPRAVNALESVGVTTIGDLLQQPVAALRAIPNFGESSLLGVFQQLVRQLVNNQLDLERRIDNATTAWPQTKEVLG